MAVQHDGQCARCVLPPVHEDPDIRLVRRPGHQLLLDENGAAHLLGELLARIGIYRLGHQSATLAKTTPVVSRPADGEGSYLQLSGW